MQAGHTASVIPDGVIKVYFFHVQIADLDEHAILLPRMSSYRVLHLDYMLLGKAPTPKGALLPQRIVSYKYLSVQLHS